MAIFDPPDGSIDPRPRCEGNCCRQFAIESSYADLMLDLKRFETDPTTSTIPDVQQIAAMLIPLGTFKGQELFTCKHLKNNRDCGIYLSRPKMCRDFPGPNPCPYRNCSSHGKQSLLKKAENWLRE
jgi:Fe-S-cluster containining protein